MLFVLVYDLYFLKQFIESNLFLLRVYTSSWLYVTDFPFFVTKVMIVFVPIKDLRITNLFVVILFTLFDMLI